MLSMVKVGSEIPIYQPGIDLGVTQKYFLSIPSFNATWRNKDPRPNLSHPQQGIICAEC